MYCLSWFSEGSKLIFLGLFALILAISPISILAQNPILNSTEKAPIVVDGRVLFEVGSISNFSAQQRASIINDILAEEVRSPDPVDVVIFDENQRTVIRNQATKRHLLTVTSADVIAGSNTFEQALVWKKYLERSLQQAQLQRTSEYLRQFSLLSIAAILGAILGHGGLILLRIWGERNWLPSWSHPSSPLYTWQGIVRPLWRIFILGTPLILWLTAIGYIGYLLPQARSALYQILMFLGQPIFVLGKNSYSATQLLLLLSLTLGLWFLVKGLVRFLKSYLLERLGTSQSVQDVVGILTQYILLFLGLIILLQLWGLDIGALAILASVLGVGIGFGLQNIANNFISGLIITLERPIQVGDFIKLGELVGTVKNIGARSTQIKTWDGISIIVPNSRFLESEVINWSYGDKTSAIRIPISVAYGSDLKRVKLALLQTAKEHPEILVVPRPTVLFQQFGDSALNFELRVWLKEPRNQFRIKSELNYAIDKNFRDYGIEIPFPQRDLNLRSPHLKPLIENILTSTEMIDKQPLEIPDFEEEPELESLEDLLTDRDLERLVHEMRSPQGLDIQNRRYRLHLYPNCFIGSEAVNWLVQRYKYTREEAVEVGQILMEKGIICHVLDQHPFQDSYLFYRFFQDDK